MQANSSAIPTPQELQRAVREVTQKYKTETIAAKMIDVLYKKLVVKQKPTVKPQLEREIKDDETVHEVFIFDQQTKREPVQTDDNQEIDVDEELLTVYSSHSKSVDLANQVQVIQRYEQILACQMFFKHGYNLQLFRREVHRQGGLFQVSQSRYKNLTTNFISEAFQKLQNFLQSTRYNLTSINKVQIIAMHSILLNCKDNFPKNEVQVFHRFIRLANDESCRQIKVSRRTAVLFYENAKRILQTKMEGERMIYSNNNFLPSPGRRARKLEPPLVDTNKSQKDIYEEYIVNLYIQYKKISDTQEQFEKKFGYHQEYSIHREIQAVIFKVCRRALRDIEQYCRQHYKILPQLTKMTDPKIKGILASTKGLNTRCKLLVLAQSFKRKEKYVIINGMNINVTNWQIEPSQLNQVDLVLLMDLINEINQFFDGREGSNITLFDGKPPNYKIQKRRNKYSMDYDATIPNGTKKRKKLGVFSKNFQDVSSEREESMAESSLD